VSSPQPPLAKTVAIKSLEWAVRFWPDDSRHWGVALLAETHEIAQPIEAFFWALGGVSLFLRSHLSHLLALLKLPPGRTTAPIPVGSGGGPRLPRNPRLVTALIFLAVVSLLLLPSGRDAARITASSWNGFGATPGEIRAVERLAAEAQKAGDARQLAFLANCEPDPARSKEFANHAVQLDPSLVWIYASRYRRPVDTVTDAQWIARLQDSDPDNAFVYLLEAQSHVDPDAWSRWWSSSIEPAHPSQVPGYSEWLAAMDRASSAPRYDSYSLRHAELTRQGWAKSPNVPLSLVTYSLWSHILPDVGLVWRYVDLRIRQGQSALAAGHPLEAEQILLQISSFAQRMVDGSQTDFERLSAFEVARRSKKNLRDLYTQTGRIADARATAAELSELETAKEIHWRNANRFRVSTHVRGRAILVQSLAFAALLIALFTLLSLVLLEMLRSAWRRFPRVGWIACRLADFGPAIVLVLAAGFLLAFQPFALALEQYRSAASASTAGPDFVSQLYVLGAAQPLVYLSQPSLQAALWMALIVVLSVIALVIIGRNVWRRAVPAHRR